MIHHTRPNMKKWDDKRYWRGFQRQVARDRILEKLDDMIEILLRSNTPANLLRVRELKSISSMIKRRRLAQRNK